MVTNARDLAGFMRVRIAQIGRQFRGLARVLTNIEVEGRSSHAP